jgi:hypothetical protein
MEQVADFLHSNPYPQDGILVNSACTVYLCTILISRINLFPTEVTYGSDQDHLYETSPKCELAEYRTRRVLIHLS